MFSIADRGLISRNLISRAILNLINNNKITIVRYLFKSFERHPRIVLTYRIRYKLLSDKLLATRLLRKFVRSWKIVGSIVESQFRPERKYARSTWNAMNMNESNVRVLLKLHLWNSSACTHPSSQPRAAFSNTYADMANRMWRYNGCGISGFTGSTEMRIGGENASMEIAASHYLREETQFFN